MQARSLFRTTFALLCIAVTVLGLINVYGDNSAVLSLAQKTACGKEGCSYTTLRQERSAITQSFTFQTKLSQKGSRDKTWSVDVECKREYVLIGDYRCNALNSPPESAQ